MKYNGSELGEFVPGTAGFEIVPDPTVQPQDTIVEKTANDSFYRSQLEDVLKKNQVEKLYLCGTETDFCVNATVQSAPVKDFQVVVLGDCHTVSDKAGLPGEQIVRYDNRIWTMLIPTRSRIEVKSIAEVAVSDL